MPDPTAWISAVRNSHDRLAELTGSLGVDEVSAPSYASEWTIADVCSHLGSQAVIFDLALDAGLSGGAAPGLDQFKPIWDEWNALAPAEQVRRSIAANAEMVSRLEALTPEQRSAYSVEMFGGTADLSRFLQFRLGEHALHTWDVAAALDPSATLLPDAATLLIDVVAEVAGRAKPVEGTGAPIAIATTDPARTFTLTLAPSVTLEPTDAAPSEAELTLPAEALIRLCYGRLDPDHTPDGIGGADRLEQLRTVFTGF